MILDHCIYVLEPTQHQAALSPQLSPQTVASHPSVRPLFPRHPFVAFDHGMLYRVLQTLQLRATSLL